MYPAHLFSLFPPFPQDNRVFVAMSFDPRFQSRYANVIAPAITDAQPNGALLTPFRVDASKVSDSILTDILSGIGSSRLVFVDVTTIDHFPGPAVRNRNVMYELGIAHAIRLPEEVLVYRSDADRLLFDTTHIRVRSYDPDGSPAACRTEIAEALRDAIREIDLRRHKAVEKTTQSLSASSFAALFDAARRSLHHPLLRNMGEILAAQERLHAIFQLLELGVIATAYIPIDSKPDATISDPITAYNLTDLGWAVYEAIREKLNIDTPEGRAAIAKMKEHEGTAGVAMAKFQQ